MTISSLLKFDTFSHCQIIKHFISIFHWFDNLSGNFRPFQVSKMPKISHFHGWKWCFREKSIALASCCLTGKFAVYNRFGRIVVDISKWVEHFFADFWFLMIFLRFFLKKYSKKIDFRYFLRLFSTMPTRNPQRCPKMHGQCQNQLDLGLESFGKGSKMSSEVKNTVPDALFTSF